MGRTIRVKNDLLSDHKSGMMGVDVAPSPLLGTSVPPFGDDLALESRDGIAIFLGVASPMLGLGPSRIRPARRVSRGSRHSR